MVSLEDELAKDFYGERLIGWLARAQRFMPGWVSKCFVSVAQSAAEHRHARTRRELLKMDEQGFAAL